MIREWWHKAPEVSNFSGHGSVFMFHTQKTLRKTLKIRNMETARQTPNTESKRCQWGEHRQLFGSQARCSSIGRMKLAFVHSQQLGERTRIQNLDNREAPGKPFLPCQEFPPWASFTATLFEKDDSFIPSIRPEGKLRARAERKQCDSSSAKLCRPAASDSRFTTGPGSRVFGISAKKRATLSQVRCVQLQARAAGARQGFHLQMSTQKAHCQTWCETCSHRNGILSSC